MAVSYFEASPTRSEPEAFAAAWYRAPVVDDSTDPELVRLIAAGGTLARAAEAALCRRFAPRVRLYGLKHLRDEDRARDLVQTVLLAVLEAARASRIEDATRLDRFVLGTCRNTVLRAHQVASRTEPFSDELLVSLSIEPIERIDTTTLLGCFDALELRAKQIVMLSFLEDRSAEDIATALSTTAGNVRVLRHRALAGMRRCLDSKQENRP